MSDSAPAVEHIHAGQEQDDWNTCMSSQNVDDDPGSSAAECTDVDSITIEVNGYMREKNIDRQSYPFTWWCVNKERYPHLGTLARRYMSAPMGSIASEREFKIAKRVVTNRWSLKPESVERLLFLKYNLRMLDFCY